MNMSLAKITKVTNSNYAGQKLAYVLSAITGAVVAVTGVAAPIAQCAVLNPPDLIDQSALSSPHTKNVKYIGSETKCDRDNNNNEILSPSCRNAKIAALSIIDFVLQNGQSPSVVQTIRISARSYSLVLQEMQKRQASFLSPGVKAPANARAVFKLETEEPGLSQTVYFL